MYFISIIENILIVLCALKQSLLSILSFANVHRESQFLAKIENGIRLRFIFNVRKNEHILEYLSI